MDDNKINNLVREYDNLSYEEKKSFYLKTFSLGYFGDSTDNLMILLSLVLLTYLKLGKSNPKVTVLAILLKITGQTNDGSYYYKMLESLSIIVEDLSHSNKNPNSCGLKNSKEIINKIKELLSTWTPF